MYNKIAIFGQRQAGKSTIANYLNQHGFTTVSIASPMRDMLRPIISAENQDCLNRDGDKNRPLPELGGKTVRDALMLLGTEWGTALIWEDMWVRNLLDRVKHQVRTVVDDCRKTREFEALREAGFVMVKVSNPGLLEVTYDHATEKDWQAQTPDVMLVNGGSIEDLHKDIARLIIDIDPHLV